MKHPNPLTVERWKAIETIFHQATEQEEPARSALVKRLCGEDAALFAEVQDVLASFDGKGENAPAEPASSRTLAGTRTGNYRLERLLGQGGMSSVYLAYRDDGQFDREVAVKLMSPHLASEFFTERFRRERQILADLDHANITRLLDGGVTENGDPYLVMEYIEGEALDEYCDRRRLMLAERIRLFLQICSAVEYAHARQIVHRDLKPGNILVTRDGVPKLLDFGTAKLLLRDKAESTTTRFGLMTLRYASPEQLCGHALTAATDVYSLGVTLYELVTGAWPFGDPQSLLAGLDRAVNEVKPAAASDAITDAAANARSSTKARLIAQVRGDLERILSKALQSKPEDRYRSVETFAADLRLFLEGKPIAAARPLALWKRRSLRASVLVVALIVFCIGLGYTARRMVTSKTAEQSIAILPFVSATDEPQSQYLASGLTAGIRDELSRDSSLRVIAGASSARFAGKNPDLGEVNRRLRVGLVLTGRIDQSHDPIEISVQLERAPGGARLWSHNYKTRALDLFSVQSDVVSSIAATLNASAGFPARNIRVPNAEAYEAAMRGRYDLQQLTTDSLRNAEAEYRHAIDLDPQYAAAYNGLADVKYDEYVARGSGHQTDSERRSAERLFRKALQLDPDLPSAHAMLGALAMQYDWDWDRAEHELRLAAAGPSSATAESVYSFFLLFHGRFPEADLHLRRMVDLDPFSSVTMNNLMLARNLEGRFAEARETAERLSAQFPKMLAPREIICGTYIEEGRTDLALPLIRQLEAGFPQARLGEAMARAKAGERNEALRLIRPFEEKYPGGDVSMQWFALVYALMGDEPNTVKWLERSADRHEWQALNLAVHPVYASMENSAGFLALKKRMGLDGK